MSSGEGRERRRGGVGRGFVFGALVGIGLGLVIAPERGVETRARIGRATSRLREWLTTVSGEALERRGEMAQMARERAGEIALLARERTEELAAIARERGEELRMAATVAAEELRARGRDVAEGAILKLRKAITEGKAESSKTSTEMEEKLRKARGKQ